MQHRTSVVLNAAADLLEGRGWIRSNWNNHRDDSPMCIEGAIFAAMGCRANMGETSSDDEYVVNLRKCAGFRAVARHIGEHAVEGYNGGIMLYPWNDNIADTKDEVISVLRAAAADEAQREAEADAAALAEAAAVVNEAGVPEPVTA